MSDEYIKGNISWSNSAPYLKSEADLERVIVEMRKRLTKLNLGEYFLCDASQKSILEKLPKIKGAEIEEFKNNIFPRIKTDFDRNKLVAFQENFLINVGHGPNPRQVDLKMPDALIFFSILHNQNVTLAVQEIAKLVQDSNTYWTNKIPEFLTEALENIRGTIRYYKIQEKKPLITKENPLVNRYFSVLSD